MTKINNSITDSNDNTVLTEINNEGRNDPS